MSKNFIPTIRDLLNDKSLILIYPEEEMWFNYRKPRPPKPGAYHYAAKYNVPIIIKDISKGKPNISKENIAFKNFATYKKISSISFFVIINYNKIVDSLFFPQ